jgi:hypothetical protein
MRRPYYVYGGLQDNQTWGGPSANGDSLGVTAGEWAKLGPYDGMHPGVDPNDWTTIYVSSQLGNLRRRHVGPAADTGLRITPVAPKGERYRFNWNAPLIMSVHAPHTIYYGGNRLFRSSDYGDHWDVLSPDLTRRQPNSRILGNTITAIGESPLRRGLLYVGTDDGKVWVTRDDGATWTDLSERIPNAAPDRWITQLEASHHDTGTVYLTLSRLRNDDDAPYVFASPDYGATWRAIRLKLPSSGQAHVIRESSRNANLLFAGTDGGLFVSLDRGTRWRRMRQIPVAPVVDLVIHPRDRELVVGTHGRGLHVVDIMPLEEASDATLSASVHLFAVRPAVAVQTRDAKPPAWPMNFDAANPPSGASIYVALGREAPEPPELRVVNGQGRVITSLLVPRSAGLHRVVWSLRARPGAPLVAPGAYAVVLRAAGRELRQPLIVEGATDRATDGRASPQ